MATVNSRRYDYETSQTEGHEFGSPAMDGQRFQWYIGPFEFTQETVVSRDMHWGFKLNADR